MQTALSQGSVVVDNLKIWNYAKTDFSDRFVERPEGYIKGDVNGDGVVGTDDAMLVMQIVVRLVFPDDLISPIRGTVADDDPALGHNRLGNHGLDSFLDECRFVAGWRD